MLKKFFNALFKNTGHKQYLYIIFIIGTVVMLCGGFGAKKLIFQKRIPLPRKAGWKFQNRMMKKGLKKFCQR